MSGLCLLEIKADKAIAMVSDQDRSWIDGRALLVSQPASHLHEDS
tara:strand:+ start:223 stop:357 length:135 start_codon:yes stop_codon:yes gene_type:complete